MLINEVISRVRRYYPSEYTPGEMYTWCDEVSSQLLINERYMYKEEKLPIAADGCILLPENVGIENVENIICNGAVLKKTAFQDVLVQHGRPAVKLPANGGTATVVYLLPYQPIRLSKYNGRTKLDKEKHIIKIYSGCFLPGDILRIKMNNEYLQNIPLFSVDWGKWDDTEDSVECYILDVAEGSLDSAAASEYAEAEITRSVTEATVCDAPFDNMYVDYCLAKIAEYQRDWSAYAQYSQLYQARYESYRKWINERMPKESKELIGWWH